MKGGRLKIINESRYPDAEVEALVKFGLSDLDVKGSKVLAIVINTRKCAYRGYAGRRGHFDRRTYKLALEAKAPYVVQMMLGETRKFPIRPFTRNGVMLDFKTWQEALVGVTAHEGRHIQHYYDDAYETRSGVRRSTGTRYSRRRPRNVSVRVGVERVEPKCAAHERQMLERFRAS